MLKELKITVSATHGYMTVDEYEEIEAHISNAVANNTLKNLQVCMSSPDGSANDNYRPVEGETWQHSSGNFLMTLRLMAVAKTIFPDETVVFTIEYKG